jgi:hypothetical protein
MGEQQKAVESLVEYSRTIKRGLQILLREEPEPRVPGPASEPDRLG